MVRRHCHLWGAMVVGLAFFPLAGCSKEPPPVKTAPPVVNQEPSLGEAEAAAVKVLEESGAKVNMHRNQQGKPVAVYSVAFPEKVKVTHAALKALKETNVERLSLGAIPNRSDVTDAELAELKQIKKLEYLMLDGTAITDAGLKEIGELTNLLWLELSRTAVTDVGVKELKNLKKLELLGLGATKITDAGLKELKELTKLEQLFLGDTQVTDAGLKELLGLTRLRNIILVRTRVTDKGVRELERALPVLERVQR